MRLKRTPKRGGSANPGIASFIDRIQRVPQDELPALLDPVVHSGWTFPRTDMQHWIYPLNRFDDILEQIIQDYDLTDMRHCQTNAFTPRTKQLLLSVLSFQKLLLENSTNRKIFNGFDRINDLLHSTDVDVLLATLRLALRPAQQYSSINSSLSSIPYSDKRLLSLAQSWGTREFGIDMVDVAQDKELEVPLELQEPEWQFYRKTAVDGSTPSAEADKDKKGKDTEMEIEQPEAVASTSTANVASTPAPLRRTASSAPQAQTPSTPAPLTVTSASSVSKPAEGLTNIHLPNLRTCDKSTVDLLLDLTETHHIPEPDRLDLLQKIRIGRSISSATASERQALLVVRLLALSVFAHAQRESVAQTKIFLYEPDLITQLADILHPDRTGVPFDVQAAALYALEAFARYKGKTSEVASALNASVSHGVLMQLIRRTATDLEQEDSKTTLEFVDALFNLLTYINMHQNIGAMVIGAGIINTLLDFVKSERRDRFIPAAKAITLLDGFLYGYTQAFTAYIAAGGLAIFVDRIKFEVDTAVADYGEQAKTTEPTVTEEPTGFLNFSRGTLLKNILRAMQRLMTTAGTTEGLRNLIDSSLLATVKTVMENRRVFGPQIFSLATNIATSFVHNEPTHLATLQEAKVPDAFYDSLEGQIPASIEVLQAIPNAMGAFCLNHAGIEQLTSRSIITAYFDLYLSPPHVTVLRDRDSAVLLGGNIDELVRHQPSLKERVMSNIKRVFEEIRVRARAFEQPADEPGYGLMPAKKADEAMAVEETEVGETQSAKDRKAEKKKREEDGERENDVTMAIDVFGRFLEGLFQNLGHCQDYFKDDESYNVLLDLIDCPCSPALMQRNGGYGSIVALFRIATEVKAYEALVHIMARTERWLGKTEWFWKRENGFDESILRGMISPTPEELADNNTKFRDLTYLLTHITLLSDVVLNLSYSNGKVATSALRACDGKGSSVLQSIGKVYQACAWENITIRPSPFWTGEATKAAVEETAKQNEAAAEASASTSATTAAVEPVTEQEAQKKAVDAITTTSTPDSPNIKLLQDTIQSFTGSILPCYTTLIKLLLHRRSSDETHRSVARIVAADIASIMRDSLVWPGAAELEANIAYSAQSLVLITKLLFDERANMTGLQTYLLRAFVAVGGLDAYLALFGKLQDVATESVFEPGPEAQLLPGTLLMPLFGADMTALELLNKLTSQKTILEAPHTALMITREKDPKHPDFFDAHEFIVRLRHAILPSLRRHWEQEWVRKTPPRCLRSLMSALINVLKAEGEVSTEPSPSRGGEGGRLLGQILGAGGLGGAGGMPGALDMLGAALGAAPPVGGIAGIFGGGPAGLVGGPGGPGGAGAGGPPQPPAPLVPDEARISQLVDMGFPRGACETALRRCRNNVGLATEYLLQHPDVVGAARAAEARAPAEPAQPEEPAAAPPAEEAPAALSAEPAAAPAPEATNQAEQPNPDQPEAAPTAAADVEMKESEESKAIVETSPPEARGPPLDEVKSQLKQARDELKPTFLDRALTLAAIFEEIVFEIKNVYSFLTASDEKGTASIQPLLDQLESYVGQTDENETKAASSRLRLLALLTTDAAYREAVEPSRETIMKYVVRLSSTYLSSPPDKDNRPKWLASVMLIADSLFSIQNVPKPTEILPEGEELPAFELIAQGPAWKDERQAFFDVTMDVLEKGISTREVFLSTLRLLLVLTRDHDLAAAFAERNGPKHLFDAFTEETPETKGCRSYVVMILRHVIEERTILKPMMEREIEVWFSNGRSKIADITGFLRGISSVAFRNIETFLEAAKSTLKLVAADAPHHYHVTLLRDPSTTAKSSDVDAVSAIKSPLAGGDATAPSGDAAMDDAALSKVAALAKSLTPSSAATEATLHFLMSQVIESSKGALASIPPPEKKEGESKEVVAREATDETTSTTKQDKDAHIPGDVPLGEFFQTAFTLACISELVAAYNPAKASFLTFSTRKGAVTAGSKEVIAPKSRSSFLYFLLNDLIPSAGLVPTSDFDSKRRTSLWGWASLVIVGLCYDSTAASIGQSADKESAQEITVVRKAVLDAVAKAYRDAMASTEPTEVRYARLSALSDLCYRLLTARPFPHVDKAHSETSMQLAKLMLEKNFATILTNALAEVDLNFPNVNTLINAILRPLENLTKIVTKVGRAKNGAPARNRFSDESSDDDLSSMSDDDEDGVEGDSDEEQQEAPDLYRNSALGMYEGELETGQHDDQYMSGEDSEGYDEDDELMDEMDEAGLEGSDLSDASDDDEEGSMAQFDDEDMDDMDDDDIDDEDDHASHIDADDIDEEVLIEDDSDADEEEILEAFEDGLVDDEDGWVDEDDDVAGLENGDELVFEGDAPIQGMDAEDDMDDGADSEEMFTDEEDAITGELEFDPEMTEQLRAQSTAQAYGWDPVTGGDGNGNRRNRIMNSEMMQLNDAGMFDRPRQTTHAAAHPLLVENPAAESAAAASSRRSRGGATSRDSPAYQEWVRSIEAMLGPNGLNTLQDVLGSHGLSHLSGPDQIRVQLAPGPNGGMAVVIDPSPALRNGAAAAAPEEAQPVRSSTGGASSSRSAARQISDRINAASAFLPVQTNQRWQEEGRILQGSVLVAERVARFVNHLINVLHAPARAIAKEEKAKEEERRKKREEEAAEMMNKEAAEREKREAEEKKRKEEEEEQKKKEKEKEEEEARARAQAEAEAEERRRQEAAAASAMEIDQPAQDVPDDVAEVMNLARSLAAGLAVPSTNTPTPDATRSATPADSQPQPQTSTSAADAMQQDVAPSADASGSGAQASAPAERVTIMIHGEEVDITDTGVDREFLEALPDDMREEVLSQHFRETRSSGPPSNVPSHINAEFLDALPPDLRAEVLRQEAAEQRRQDEAAARAARAREAAQADGPPLHDDGDRAGPEDDDEDQDRDDDDDGQMLGGLDPAALLAGLVGQAAGFGAPGGGHAGMPAFGRLMAQPIDGGPLGGGRSGNGRRVPEGDRPAPATKKATPHREVIQLLDKSGLATLVRLLFFPQPLRRNSLQKVLVHLCENSRTRVELINLLLTILQDGTRDVSAVDKSFSQMSIRASKSLLAKDKDTPKRKAPETPGPNSALPHFPGESVPNLIAQRCLEALAYLVSANEQTPLFFLTEQEVAVNRRAAKKGKGKEKPQPTTTFPLIILLGLLERPALLKTPSMMDSLTTLLASVTRSLSVLQKKPKPTDAAVPGTAASSGPSDAATSTTATAQAAVPAADDTAAVPAADKGKDKDKDSDESPSADILLKNPPQIPESSLRLVVNVLDAGECSSRTFSQTLTLIQNLSHLDSGRDTILDELRSRAEKISNELIPDLKELLETISRDETVSSATLSKFTPASSSQAKLLRILKTIDFFGTAPKKNAGSNKSNADKTLSPEEEQVKTLYSHLASSDLWKRLGDALGGIEAKPELLYLSTVLLPLIESLLVVNKFTDASSTEFIDFTTAHSKILNTMVRNNPSLMSGSFAVLVRNSTMLDFENKRSFFFSRLHDRTQRQRGHYGTINLNVRRAHVFEDSFHVLQRKSGDEIKYGKLNVKFYDEEGVDAGGVTREWFGVLARQMFNPNYALFQPQAADALTYQPNKSSSVNEEHLLYFRFVGRIIGKALHDQRILEAYFSRSVYKHMLGKPVDHRDLESIDPEYYKSLVWMLENDIDGVIELNFSVERDEFGVVETIDLIPNGRNVAVTNENKGEYVRLIADQRLSIEIKDQMDALLKGLYEIVPKDLMQIFTERELELLISGLPEIDADEWRANTDLVGYSATDPIIGYFWRAVRSFSHEERAKLLQFVSGSSRVPLEGFGSLQGMSGITKFNIHRSGATSALPTAHTCFNQLDIPSGFTSYEDFRKKLLIAITEGNTGFAFA
ncbi:E3 ubiquitin-protein ligase TOM1 [Sporobolomyces koalae]|uniref:E3 ubiquitin-protein ligase TOM1 n=1 Tax=Sporobolomyces koalae TaxID=500713 RepID=UPI003180D34E